MHAVFMVYGIKGHVDQFLMDLQCQNFELPLTKGKQKAKAYIKGHLRVCPFGVYEYCFPREYKDIVLTSLKFHSYNNRYNLGKIREFGVRMALKAESIPEFKTDQFYLWFTTHIEIIPIGVRYDVDNDTPIGDFVGWTHEAL